LCGRHSVELRSLHGVVCFCYVLSPSFFSGSRRPPRSTLFPYTDALPICWFTQTTLNALVRNPVCVLRRVSGVEVMAPCFSAAALDRKSTRLNSSHRTISYAVFCLKKKTIPPLLPRTYDSMCAWPGYPLTP